VVWATNYSIVMSQTHSHHAEWVLATDWLVIFHALQRYHQLEDGYINKVY